MKEYTDQEFAAVVDACAAEVEEMLKPKKEEAVPAPKKLSWARRLIAFL